jgi:VCBS repeat-containing protein
VNTSTPGQISVVLSGTASLAAYQSALRQVVFGSSSDDPGATRDVAVTVGDDTTSSNTAHTTIAVTAVNDPPVAQNGSAGGSEDTAISGNAVAVDPDNTPAQLAYSLVGANGGAQHGAVTLNPNGSFTYTPAADFNGTDSFAFKANDGAADSNVGTVSITVAAVNDAPRDITGGPLSIDENSALGALVGTVVGQDPENQTLAYALTDDAGGRFAIDNAGHVTVANGVLLDYEQSASHAVTVRATDPAGLFVDKVFAIAVNDLNPELAVGGPGDDRLLGGFADDTINGNGGDDVLFGGGGNDYVIGGDGNDKAFGEAGNDTLIGGDGHDYLNGGGGDDLIAGDEGNDTLLGEAGNDYLDGGNGADLLMGGAGSDTVLGGNGDDYVNGSDGDDHVFGGAGADVLIGELGNDYLDGENGDDIVFGDGGNDTVVGGAGNDYLSAGSGNDVLTGGTGNDTLFAGSGSDYLQGDGGDDVFVFDASFQTSLIIDFETGSPAHHDVIQFNGGIFANFADVMAHAVQDATNVVITSNAGDTLTLANVLKASLTTDDFVFA